MARPRKLNPLGYNAPSRFARSLPLMMSRPMTCRPYAARCLFVALLAGLTGPPMVGWAATRQPALIVVVSVDQLAAEYLERFSAGFSEKGIFRLCAAHGVWFTNCHHRHA